MARVRLTKQDQDPRGGLSAAGRRKYAAAGQHLRPGVRVIRSREDLRRKGSFLRRFYAREHIPPLWKNGEPTRYALAAAAWGEQPPATMGDVRALARLGARLLEAYRLSA